MTWYDNVYLGSPEPNKKEEYIEKRVEELSEDMDFLVQQDWFHTCIDWDKVNECLADYAEKELEDLKAEAQISAWETKQESRYNDY